MSPERVSTTSSAIARELLPFACAVLVGAVTGLVSQQFLLKVMSPTLAGNLSLALATTCTGAAHAHLVHHRPLSYLLPHVLAGAPIAYVVMRAVHLLAGW